MIIIATVTDSKALERAEIIAALRAIEVGGVSGKYHGPYLFRMQDALTDAAAMLGRDAETNNPLTLEFDVVDTQTGKYPDFWDISINEQWAEGLMYRDMDGFAIDEDGNLILIDVYGNFVHPPQERFKVVFCKPDGGGE